MRAGGVRAPAVAGPEAVRLLTVHGAKGLEADVVFVADADPEPRRHETCTLLVDWPVGADAPGMEYSGAAMAGAGWVRVRVGVRAGRQLA